ncbi:MAG: riboflavin biosynthesis protein RibF [Oscillospiraceae bacterium]|jgi:riboflavin kinase/FMN adenylyltransferase|nr:riboflavin biosynthesis protein RibF [Oscillospiraceae bacterium]
MNNAIALGTFDGLHLGHRKVLGAALSLARRHGLQPMALLFSEHPQAVITGQAPARLLQNDTRNRMLRELGFHLREIDFASIRSVGAEVFFKDILRAELHAGAIAAGYDYRFGADAFGDAALLATLCENEAIPYTIVPKITYQNEAISASRIRAAIQNGDMQSASAMLGEAFSYAFPVVEGDRIGRTLGAPTINQLFPHGYIVPRFGVYAAAALVDGAWHAAVTNIGRRPSFANDELRSETHILGYTGDLYGQSIPVRLLRFLRPERAFASMGDLAEQIALDKSQVREM